MDQNTVVELVKPDPAAPGEGWREGDVWLAGGTFLLSLPLPQIRRFRDLSELGWTPVEVNDAGLEIAATCKVSELMAYQPDPGWAAGPLLHDCVRAFLASFKVWNGQTVGGNICTSIPAGPMTTMACALDADYLLISPDGSERTVPAIDFVTGNNVNILRPGELMRKLTISAAALNRRYALRRFSLTKAGRSSVFLVGTRDPESGEFLLTVSAATIHPFHIRDAGVPSAAALLDMLAEIPDDKYFDDPNGRPDHRKHMTDLFAEEIRSELAN
ncbi:MAG: FAD binding domain-containing protein [Actinobacteria bacterium]|nr:FAD binding domain-containing protein [Actinomycetota bacterium]